MWTLGSALNSFRWSSRNCPGTGQGLPAFSPGIALAKRIMRWRIFLRTRYCVNNCIRVKILSRQIPVSVLRSKITWTVTVTRIHSPKSWGCDSLNWRAWPPCVAFTRTAEGCASITRYHQSWQRYVLSHLLNLIVPYSKRGDQIFTFDISPVYQFPV